MLICGLLSLAINPAAALDACTTPGVFENCQTATAWSSSNATLDAYYAGQTQTAVATYYATATPSPALGTPSFFDLLSSPTPEGTAGVNLSCPSEPFDTANLDPQWSLICERCVYEQEGTPTRIFGQEVIAFPTFDFQTPDLRTATPIMSTATATYTPSPTSTTTGHQHAIIDFDGRSDVPWDNNGWHETGLTAGRTGQAAAAFPYSTGSSWQMGWYNDAARSFHMQLPSSWTIYKITMWTRVSALTANGGQVGPYFTRDAGFSATAPWNFNQTTTWQQTTINWGDTGVAGSDYWFAFARATTTSGGAIFMIDDIDIEYSGVPFTPTPTASPSPTSTGTSVPTFTPSPDYAATAFHPFDGWSVNCSVPKYYNLDKPAAAVEISASGTSACWTVIPNIDFSFDLINNTIGSLLSFSIPAFQVEQADVCFVGVSFVLQLFGFAVDLSVAIGLPMLAWVVRWVLRL